MRKSHVNGPLPISFVAPDVTQALLPVVITDVPTIQCKRCKNYLPQTEEFFYRHKKRNWWQSWCRECQKARMVEIRAMRKRDIVNSPFPNDPHANATLTYLRKQLDIVSKKEAKTLVKLTACHDARVRIERALGAWLKPE